MLSIEYSRIINFCKEFGGDKIRPILEIKRFPVYNELLFEKDIENVMLAMDQIVKEFLSNKSIDDFCDQFGIIPEVRAFIQNPCASKSSMLRVDFMVDTHGQPKICELNVDSSIGGAEIAGISRMKYSQASESTICAKEPYDLLADYFKEIIQKNDVNQICIFDFSKWIEYGAFSSVYLKNILFEKIPGVKILCVDENNYENVIDSRTLVYRQFLLEDSLDNLDLLHKIYSKTSHVVTDFSGEIWGNKKWLEMIWRYHQAHFFNKEVSDSIQRTMMPTYVVNSDNLELLIRNQRKYVFKKIDSYGGQDILVGKECRQDELLNVLEKAIEDKKQWIAQEYIHSYPICIHAEQGNRCREFLANYVLGKYRINHKWSGDLVRASAISSIVNVQNGSYIGWSS